MATPPPSSRDLRPAPSAPPPPRPPTTTLLSGCRRGSCTQLVCACSREQPEGRSGWRATLSSSSQQLLQASPHRSRTFWAYRAALYSPGAHAARSGTGLSSRALRTSLSLSPVRSGAAPACSCGHRHHASGPHMAVGVLGQRSSPLRGIGSWTGRREHDIHRMEHDTRQH